MSEKQDNTGNVPFIVMILIIIFLFAVCIICPLVVANWSKQAFALPLMAAGLLLPFVHFFIFGGAQLGRDKKNKK